MVFAEDILEYRLIARRQMRRAMFSQTHEEAESQSAHIYITSMDEGKLEDTQAPAHDARTVSPSIAPTQPQPPQHPPRPPHPLDLLQERGGASQEDAQEAVVPPPAPTPPTPDRPPMEVGWCRLTLFDQGLTPLGFNA